MPTFKTTILGNLPIHVEIDFIGCLENIYDLNGKRLEFDGVLFKDRDGKYVDIAALLDEQIADYANQRREQEKYRQRILSRRID